jgi:hypothetical protein
MIMTAPTSRILTAFALIIGLTGAVLALPAKAADGSTLGYQISPPVTTLSLDPGTSTRQTIKVTNLTDKQLTLQLDKRNFVAKGEEGEVELVDNANPLYSLAPYFTLSQPTVTVPPRGTSQVQYVLSIPKDAEPGGRYGSVTFNTIAEKLPNGQSGASVQQELAALIFLRINGAANEQLKIASFTTAKSFAEYGPVNFTTRIQNLGNVHEKPTGQIVVKNMFGFTTAKVSMDEKNVIPGAIRKINTTLNKKYLFGTYNATLTLQNGTIQTLTAKTSFTIIPYKLLGIILLIIFFLAVILTKGRKRIGRAVSILAGRE